MILLCLVSCDVAPENKSFKDENVDNVKDKYADIKLHDLKFSHEIESALQSGELGESTAAYYYTYIGKTREAQQKYQLGLTWGFDKINKTDSLKLLTYNAVNVYDYLLPKIKEEQVVIISEAHQKPEHRVFTRKLLKQLYESGFRHLGLEALNPNFEDTTKFLFDTELNERGYPLNSHSTGTFIREPQMGNLVREAIKLGYQLFSYERINRDEDRDLIQARNIKKYMDQHPNEKILIHCGWNHAIESDYPKRKDHHWMAYHLKKMTDINPLTIYQDVFSEGQTNAENPYYNLIQSDDVSVSVDDKGEVFNGFDGQKHFDILIYHPRAKYKYNRPNWLSDLKGNKFVDIKGEIIPENRFPVVIKAYLKHESKSGTPIDIIELKDSKDNTKLVLPLGTYKIIKMDRFRNESEYIEEVK